MNGFYSEIENKNDIYSIEQLEARQSLPSATATVEPPTAEKCCKQEVNKLEPIIIVTDNKIGAEVKSNEFVKQVKSNDRQQQIVVPKKSPIAETTASVVIECNPRPRSVTASVFVAGGAAVSPNATSDSGIVTSPLLPKAVTASVFTPISTIQQQQQQNQVLPPNQQQPPHHRPQPATAKIFVPRTDDMNKGFLMFSDDGPELTSKCSLCLFPFDGFLLLLYICYI